MKDRQKKELDQTTAISCRPVPPKMVATDGTEGDPLVVYDFFFPGREVTQDGVLSYLAVCNSLHTVSLATKGWFKSGAVGVNKLNGVMKTIV